MRKQEKAQKIPETTLTGVNAKSTKSVLVSAILEVHGQVRFGDGTDVGLTITETDMVRRPSDGAQLEKFIFAGSKRRGVDRRTIHELRDRHWNGEPCYIPQLCCMCPICWLYGFTGTTQDKNINAKSRVLYASSVSVEEVQLGLNTHSRNQVDEKTQMTAGAAGIHEEQVIVAGIHFPTYTALVHVLDWEIGILAHALLENINSNRYTAASRSQGGMMFAEHNNTPLIIVDESEQGIFPLAAPKIAGWINDWLEASKRFAGAMTISELKKVLEQQGFTVSAPRVDSPDPTKNDSAGELGKGNTANASDSETAMAQLILEEQESGIIKVKQNEHVLMTRYIGIKALGYLRQKQLVAKQQLMKLNAQCFQTEINSYITAISPKSDSTSKVGTADTGGVDEETTTT